MPFSCCVRDVLHASPRFERAVRTVCAGKTGSERACRTSETLFCPHKPSERRVPNVERRIGRFKLPVRNVGMLRTGRSKGSCGQRKVSNVRHARSED